MADLMFEPLSEQLLEKHSNQPEFVQWDENMVFTLGRFCEFCVPSDPKTDDDLFRSTAGLFEPAGFAISLARDISTVVTPVQSQSSFAFAPRWMIRRRYTSGGHMTICQTFCWYPKFDTPVYRVAVNSCFTPRLAHDCSEPLRKQNGVKSDIGFS